MRHHRSWRCGGAYYIEVAGMDVPIDREASPAKPRTIIYFARNILGRGPSLGGEVVEPS